MPSIQSLGVGSGIDIDMLVNRVMDAEAQKPTERLEAKETKARLSISAYGKLKSSLQDFRNSLNDLKDLSKFSTRTAKVTNSTTSTDSYFTAVAAGNANNGSYDVTVTRLAVAHKLSSKAFNNEQQGIGTGTLNITVGHATYSVDISSYDNSLTGIRQKINSIAGDDLSVTTLIADDGARLIFSSANPGLDHQISISVVNDGDTDNTNDGGLSQLISSNLTVEAAAVNAEIIVDNHTITRSSNDITGAIDGLTLNLLKADPGNAHKLKVAEDSTKARAAIDSFIKNYNDLFETMNDLSGVNDQLLLMGLKKPEESENKTLDPKSTSACAETAKKKTDGALLGDSTLRLIDRHFRDCITQQISNTIGFRSIAEIGIVSELRTGKLEIAKDSLTFEDKVTKSLKDNFDAVGRLFGGDSGIAKKLDDYVYGLLKVGGTIELHTDQHTSELHRINEERQVLIDKLAMMEQRLLKKFSSMDERVSKLNKISSFITESLSKLKVSKPDKGK